MAAADVQELARLLSVAHAPGPQMVQASEQLFSCELRPGFGAALLQLVQSETVDLGIRQAGSIYMKNYVKRRWGNEQGGVPPNERDLIKEALLPLVLQVPRLIRAQLLACLEEIASADFPSDWPQLLDELSRLVAVAQGASAQAAALDAAHAVLGRFRGSGSGDPVREARSCAETYGPAHLQVWKSACERALCGALPPDQLAAHWELLRSAVSVFHDLHAQVLPSFFCDNREVYLEAFIALFGVRGSSLLTAGAPPGPLEDLLGDLCAVLSLYASRYEEQFGPYVGRCTKAVWDLLTAIGQREELDQLASAGISFLTAAAATDWPSSPFEDRAALQAICEHVVLPNVQLRLSDLEMFAEAPQDFIARDVEGGDEETRRRSAMDLVRSLRRFHNAHICELLAAAASRLLEHSAAAAASGGAGSAEALLRRDACIHLVIAMAAPVSSQGGLNAGIVEQFFVAQVLPELQKEDLPKGTELLRAACLKFVTVLRTVLPAPCVQSAMPAVSRHILAEHPVVHTYAALCANVVTTVQEPTGPDGQRRNRFDVQSLRPSLVPMVLPMLHILAERRGIPQNEHVARALVALLLFLQVAALEVAPQALQLLVRTISDVLAPNPANPECVHAVFESCALLLKLLVPAGSAAEVEAVLLPVLGQIWEKKVSELLPYCFQILALLLDLGGQASPQGGCYAELFGRVLDAELWASPGNVPGIIRLLRAYFAKHYAFQSMLHGSMQTVFERFQFALGHRKLGGSAFALLNAILRHLPPDVYHQYFCTALALSLSRLQAKKSPELEKELVVSMSLFVFLQRDPEALPRVLGHIQPGSLEHFLTRIWLPSASKVLLLHRRKVCMVGLATLMACTEIRSNPQLLRSCCDCLAGLLKWRNAGLMCWLSTVLLPRLLGDEPNESQQYEAAFCRLQHGEAGTTSTGGAGWDLLPEIQDRISALRAVREALTPIRPAIEALEKVPAALAEVWQQQPP